jgi:hypothetical protein
MVVFSFVTAVADFRAALIHLHAGLSAQMRLNAKEITARVENIAIELGGADKAQVIFDA